MHVIAKKLEDGRYQVLGRIVWEDTGDYLYVDKKILQGKPVPVDPRINKLCDKCAENINNEKCDTGLNLKDKKKHCPHFVGRK